MVKQMKYVFVVSFFVVVLNGFMGTVSLFFSRNALGSDFSSGHGHTNFVRMAEVFDVIASHAGKRSRNC